MLQRINNNVFPDVDAVMDNFKLTTNHLYGSFLLGGHGKKGSVQTLRPTKDGCSYLKDDTGCWRMMNYIENSYSCEASDDPVVFYEIGKAYGSFISSLSDFPEGSLHETIRAFHDTRKRFDDLLLAAQSDICGRRKSAVKEICFAMEHESDLDILSEPAARGELPLRVTHNDTKINNVMLDRDSPKAICVVDLDPVMPGLAVTDFGDKVRSYAATGREDEKDADSVRLDMDIYRSLERGFLKGFPDITAAERRMLPAGAKVMTLECGIRFLTDFLEGDHYFRTDYPEHNLIRCRTQFSLLKDIEEKWKELKNQV
jgi:hypothetical protein